jgi:protein-S-isoprenylcysteine O-methyltransferase Ste14
MGEKGFQLSWKHWAIRGAFLALVSSTLAFYQHFAESFYAYFTGSLLGFVIKGQWQHVVLNILAFVSFLIPLSYRRKVDWKEYGLVVAFFVSLFIEMYGIPLTVALTAHLIGVPPTEHVRHVLIVPLLGVDLAFTVPMVYGAILMLVGTGWIMVGWVTLYRGMRKNQLITTGIYSISRNPQYVGFIMIIVGWFVGWPTLLTIIFTPILLFVYIRLCKVEESEISRLPGFEQYKECVPLLI